MIRTGTIIKGIGGFYYILSEGKEYELRARGKFRREGIKPRVGDIVEFDDTSEWIDIIKERKNCIIRPPVANIDNLGIIISASKPKPDFILVDKLIICAEMNSIKPFLIINKSDLLEQNEIDKIRLQYRSTGYLTFVISCVNGYGINNLKSDIPRGITTFAGQSGVGKSTLLNTLFNSFDQETGVVSSKIQRGKHTTRHSELKVVDNERMMVDTPGFSSLSVDSYESIDIQKCYPDFKGIVCQHGNCMHISEPGCKVKEQVVKGNINTSRYERYVAIINEIMSKRRNYR